jgi:hypothetical protein
MTKCKFFTLGTSASDWIFSCQKLLMIFKQFHTGWCLKTKEKRASHIKLIPSPNFGLGGVGVKTKKSWTNLCGVLFSCFFFKKIADTSPKRGHLSHIYPKHFASALGHTLTFKRSLIMKCFDVFANKMECG